MYVRYINTYMYVCITIQTHMLNRFLFTSLFALYVAHITTQMACQRHLNSYYLVVVFVDLTSTCSFEFIYLIFSFRLFVFIYFYCNLYYLDCYFRISSQDFSNYSIFVFRFLLKFYTNYIYVLCVFIYFVFRNQTTYK